MSYQSMTLPMLKEELKKLGLKTSGKKDELIQRLKEGKAQKKEDKEDVDKKDVEDEEEEEATTTTTTKAKGKGKGKAKKEEEDDNDDNDEKDEEDGANEKKGKGKRKLDDDDADNADADEKPKKKGKGENLSDDDIIGNLKEEGWKEALTPEFSKSYFKSILKFLEKEYADGAEIFPPRHEIFSAFNYTPLDQVKVVILGQDPYHDNNQANGLCFSVRDGITHPPSLKNIFKELESDISGFKKPKSGSLEQWAKRGVLLLNATLTVKAHTANSHHKCGWLTFTDAVIEVLNKKTKGVVFILWGGFAQKKGKIIDRKKHFVIEAAHPSPLSASKFFGCKSFSKANAILEREGLDKIDWTL